MNPQNRVGQQLNNRYLIEELLGQGGMSTVFKGLDSHLDRPVAIKIIHTFLAIHEKFLTRFQREAAAVARLRHPHIVQVYDFDQIGDDYFMVMEFVEGQSLQQHLRGFQDGNARFTSGKCIEIIAQLSGAVDYAHRQQMIHRDLKPANIMIRPEGDPVLMDFGIAKMLDHETPLTHTGAVMGTVAYMAPEQVKGDEIDHRADIYSLGVILYELLTGNRPYDAETQFATMMKHLHDPLPDLSKAVAPGAPENIVRLTAVIQKAMAKRREDRYQSAAGLQQVLQAILADPRSDLTTILETTLPPVKGEKRERPSTFPTPAEARADAERRIVVLAGDLAANPFQEDRLRELMDLQARCGDFLGPLRRYNQLEKLLQEELDLEPMPATTALRDRILAARMTAATNLLPEVTPFVGRETELGQITALLKNPDYRLVTLQGSGGMGKTRLARAAMRLIGDEQWRTFLHGAYFVPLAAAESLEDLIYAICKEVDLVLSGQQEPVEQLKHFFAERELLLVLDNFEHLAGHADLIFQLLAAAPDLKCLVTSRLRLNLPGETIYPVGGLQFGEPTGPIGETLGLDDSTRLFLQASRKINPLFRLSEEDQYHVFRISALVDGMPLGIELAASWTRLISCAEIVNRLETGFDLLASDQTQLPDRHRNIRAVFRYSWDLLPEEDQQILACLSIFRSQFDFEAAQVITRATLEQIRRLVDHSLLQAVLVDERTQSPMNRVYSLHETVRTHAAEMQGADPVLEEAVRAAYIDYYTQFVAEQEAALLGRDQRASWEAIGQKLDNIRQAWIMAVQSREVEALARAANPVFLYYTMGGLYLEGVQLFELAAAEIPRESPGGLYYRLVNRQAAFYVSLARYAEAQALCDACQADWNALEAHLDQGEIAWLLSLQAEIHWRQGLFTEAKPLLEQARAKSVAAANRYVQGLILNQFGVIHYLQGEFYQAYQLYEESLKVFEAMGNEFNASRLRANLALYQVAIQEYEAGKEGLQADLEMARIWQNKGKMAADLLNLAWADLALKRYEDARRYIEESLVYYQVVGDREGEATALIVLGQITWEQQEKAAARRHFTHSLRLSLAVHADPKALECVAALCHSLIETEPDKAWTYCQFALNHPHANKMARTRSQTVLDLLQEMVPKAQKARLNALAQTLDLKTVASDLLARFGRQVLP